MKRSTVEVRRVHLDRGGYDKNGRYYGTGEKVWMVFVDTINAELSTTVRASSQKKAKEKALMQLVYEGKLSATEEPKLYRRRRQYGPTRRHMRRGPHLAKLHE